MTFARAATAVVLGIIATGPAPTPADASTQPVANPAVHPENIVRILDDDGRAPPTLAMFTQDFAVVPGEAWRARYEVFGTLGEELAAALGEPVVLAVDPETGLFDPTAEAAIIDPLRDYTIRVTAHVPVDSRPELIEVLNGLLTNALDGASVDPAAALRLGADGIVEMDLSVPIAVGGDLAAELELPRAGVYPITVEVRRRNELLARHLTFIERLDDVDRGSYRLAVVAVVEDPGLTPRPADLAELRLRLFELTELAEAVDAAISVNFPVGALAALDDDPELAERLRTALRSAEIIAVPEVPLNPSAIADADRAAVYTRSLRLGEDRLAEYFEDSEIRRTSWIGEPTPSAPGAAMLRDLGTRLLIVPFEELAGLGSATSADSSGLDPSLLIPVALPDGTEMDLMAIDPVSRLTAPELAGVRTPAERAVTVLAELAAHQIALGPRQRSAIIAAPAGTIPDADVIGQLEAMARSHPRLDLDAVTAVAAGGDRRTGPAQPLADYDGPSLQRRADRIDMTAALAGAVASMLPADDPRPVEWTNRFGNLLSPSYSNLQLSETLREIEGDLDAILVAVDLPEPFTFTLTGRTSEVDLRIVNNSDTPLSILLESASAKLAFPEGDIETVLEPGLNIVQVPVQTLANGTFPVTFTARTPLGGVEVTDTLTLTARANAFSGLGQVLTVGALLVLLSWWYSHLRGRRRADGDVAGGDVDDADESDDGDGDERETEPVATTDRPGDHERPIGRSEADEATDTVASP
jgi:hypothetical protein